MSKHKEPTITSLVLDALRMTDNDFMDYRMLTKATGHTTTQVSAACYCLRKYRAVDVVIETDGRGWWFALPPEMDTRMYTVEERTPESHPRKVRKGSRRIVSLKPEDFVQPMP